MTPETLYVNQASSLNRGSQVLLSVTPSTNVGIQVVGGRLIISGVKAPWVSSLTSSSKRYCTSNVVSHDCVSMCSKNDYGLHFHLFGDHSIHKHLILCLHLTQILAPRSLRKIPHHWPDILLDDRIHVPPTKFLQHSTNSTWVGVLIRTVCPLPRHGRFPSAVPATSTCTGVSAQPPTEIRLRFADAFASSSKVFLSLVMCSTDSVYTSRKRFLWGPHDVGSDSLDDATVLSLPIVVFPMLGSMCHSTLNDSYRNLFPQKTHWG